MQQPSPWLLPLLVIACLLGAATLWAWRSRRAQPQALPSEWALNPRPVFSRDERRLYRQLRTALPHFVLLSKLPLVRFCQPADPRAVRYWYELLGNSHVTFAVCSANGRVLAAIDLSDERGGLRRRGQIKQSVLSACQIKHLTCTPRHMPSIAALQMLVPRSPRGSTANADTPPAATPPPRRRERGTHWQGSSYVHDSFFNPDSRSDTHPGLIVSELPLDAADIGGIVSDAPPPVRLQH